MTIILTIPTRDGLVMASDGQITSGAIRVTGKKIKELNKNCLWAGAGREALIQRVEEEISKLSDKTAYLQNLRDNLSRIIRKCVIDLHQLDQQPPEGDFVFCEYRDSSHILHITISGTPEWIRTGAFACGIGRMFAHALLQKYWPLIPDKIDVQKGTLLVFKVIEEAIEVGAYGLGSPIDVWQITKEGEKNLESEEVSGLEDLSRGLREAEIEMFLKKE